MKPTLIANLFYAKGPKIYLTMKGPKVVDYRIYSSLEPLKLVLTNGRTYTLGEGEILEVTVDHWKIDNKLIRRFFQYDGKKNKFIELQFDEEKEDMEGEYVLMKHLGLLGKKTPDEALAYLELLLKKSGK